MVTTVSGAVPVFNPAEPHEVIASKNAPDYYIQGTNVFNHRKLFWYSLSHELKPSEMTDNAGYKVEILETPEPYDVPESEKYACPFCDYTTGTKIQVDRHSRAVHKKNISELKIEIKKQGETK